MKIIDFNNMFERVNLKLEYGIAILCKFDSEVDFIKERIDKEYMSILYDDNRYLIITQKPREIIDCLIYEYNDK